MNYEIIRPPFTLEYQTMSKKELATYMKWFFDVLDSRIVILQEAVRSTPGFSDWVADRTVNSLNDLGRWLVKTLSTRPRTAREMEAAQSGGPHETAIQDYELTNQTFSLAFDVGMYFSQVLLANNPTLRWEQGKGSRRFVDFGQPVLVEFTSAPFNPVRMMVTFAYAAVSGERNDESLRALYEIWTKLIKRNTGRCSAAPQDCQHQRLRRRHRVSFSAIQNHRSLRRNRQTTSCRR
jgi:hypothetical protein